MKAAKNALMLFIACLVSLVLCVSKARAIPVPILDVMELEKGAPIIIAGEVSSKVEVERGVYKLREHDVDARIIEATIHVDRTLKGKASSEYKVRFYESDEMLGFDYLSLGRYGIFFLKREGSNYVFVSPYYYSIIASHGDCSSEGTPLARLAMEMTCVLRLPQAKMRQRFDAISALKTIETEAATLALKSAAEEQPEPINYLAADELIKRGDLSVLPLAERALEKSADIQIMEEGFNMRTGWRNIESISDKRAIPFLSRLVHAPDQRIRQQALRALGHTKDRAAIAALLEGLDDREADVRWYAVMGFAEMTEDEDSDGEWDPDFKKFEENEPRYITHWKVWALGQKVRPLDEQK